MVVRDVASTKGTSTSTSTKYYISDGSKCQEDQQTAGPFTQLVYINSKN